MTWPVTKFDILKSVDWGIFSHESIITCFSIVNSWTFGFSSIHISFIIHKMIFMLLIDSDKESYFITDEKWLQMKNDYWRIKVFFTQWKLVLSCSIVTFSLPFISSFENELCFNVFWCLNVVRVQLTINRECTVIVDYNSPSNNIMSNPFLIIDHTKKLQ